MPAFKSRASSSFSKKGFKVPGNFPKSENEGDEAPTIKHDDDDLGDFESIMTASNENRFLRAKVNDTADRRYGFESFVGPGERSGWLLNMHPTDILDDSKRLVSAVDFYFIQSDGSRFKVTRPYLPYFYVSVRGGGSSERDATTYLMRRFGGRISSIESVTKEDLDLPNHLVGLKVTYLKLLFFSVDELVRVRKELSARVRANKELASSESTYTEMLAEHFSCNNETSGVTMGVSKQNRGDPLDNLMDLRESDVPYLTRVCIDLSIFAGCWYTVRCRPSHPVEILKNEDTVTWPEPIVLAFDIETTKLPLKFPDPSADQIMMISYMLDGSGYLICNREIISEDVEDFDFTPRPEFPGHFTVHNLTNELDCINFFFDHIKRVKPNIMVTYNGDFFDWPFIEARAAHYGLSMSEEIAFSKQKSTAGPGRDGTMGEYLSRPVVHIDCLCWVKRDSYLPVGARGLKAVAKAKLRYDPIQVDPEAMCRMARESPIELANYSVSDAVATYYLYMKYVHPFVFALCTILPLNPDDVLRKGSGTLCEALLMVQAYAANVIFPHKQTSGDGGSFLPDGSGSLGKFSEDGHLIDSETYIGGHVEALEAGVFRADIPVRFRLVPAALEMLRSDVRRCLRRTLQLEVGAEDEDALDSLIPRENFDKVCKTVEDSLAQLSATPNRIECPVIYHLDVGAMYPNIILTNRLQPSAVDSESTARCSDCHFYKPGVTCQRFMPWTWRAELWTATRPEVYRVEAQLGQERFPIKDIDPKDGRPRTLMKAFHELSKEDKANVVKKRLTDFCRRAYKRIHVTRTEVRTAMVCQRENSFYVDTVRAFRDMRYKYKGLSKVWKRRYDEACSAATAGTGDSNAVKETNAMLVLYDSLQLAYKTILNSFYGYVMRRGARWYSMEMAGIVCHTGANIITKAREIIEQVGRGLELDTDGIWCILPASFPQNVEFKAVSGSKPSRISISYPGAILNMMVQDQFTNHQYHELTDPSTLTYKVRSENSIFFEVDGPYKAMILPAAKEEGKRLKKRYAVFNFDGSLAELKGFEIKRNGELQLIKIFQSSVFEAFLRGRTLVEVYAAVANVADHWLDVLYSKGADMPDSELFELISENRSMSRRLEDYGAQKSTSISTAKRMAEFLGDQIVKDSGLSCRFVISRQPEGAPVTERAIPLAIFQTEPSVKRHYLRKWLKDTNLDENTDLREILDWAYYIERLSSAIQKIITIPAALQQVPNPVPRVSHPDWLLKRLAEKTDTFKQRKLTEMFSSCDLPTDPMPSKHQVTDIEELVESDSTCRTKLGQIVVSRHRPSFPAVKRARSPSAGPPKPWREQLGDPPRLDDCETSEALSNWLAFHQAKWKIQAERRAYMAKHDPGRLDAGLNSLDLMSTSKRQCGMARYLTQTRLALYNTVWQIIEIVPDPGQPGCFTLWILLSSGSQSTLHTISLTVPRRFYVNLHTPKPVDSGPLYRKVAGANTISTTSQDTPGSSSRILPRNHPVYHLYEYTVPEEVYLTHASDIAADLARPDIEGVYELGIPTLFRALVKLGCLCKVDRDAVAGRKDQEETSFTLDELRFCSLAQHPYLSSFGELRHVYLFHYQQPQMGRRDSTRQLYFLIVPWTRLGYVCLIDSARVNQIPDLNSLYAKQRSKFCSDAYQGNFPPKSINFEVRIESDATSGRRLVQRWLTSLRQGKNPSDSGSSTDTGTSSSAAPIIVLLHASVPPLSQSVNVESTDVSWPLGNTMVSRRRSPQLTALASFPVIPLGGTLDETDTQTGDDPEAAMDAYSLLNWQQTAAKRGIWYFIQSEARFERQLELARYLHIPVGNIPVPDAPFPLVPQQGPEPEPQPPASSITSIELGCDLFYARYLAKQNHLLWCSVSDRPDLGGKETDDQRLLLEMEESGVVEINRPGCYPHVSVELELSNLAVNTLLVANRIPELEGATLMSFDRLSATDRTLEEQLNQGVNLGSTITSYDETAACSAAFRVLRTMVSGWVRDVTQFQNPLADEQIIYFYQWLRNPRSLFYDPALRRTVQKLMKKVFLKLVDELNHLRVDVVYASFSRLIISTHRMELPEALSRVEHFTHLLRTRPGTLFTHLDMQYVSSWRQLFWMDSANYAGIKANVDSLVDGKDLEWGDSQSNSATTTTDSTDPTDEQHQERPSTPNDLPEPEIDMHWHIARYLPETRGLRSKFQSLLAGYILAVYNAVRKEHRRIRGLSSSQAVMETRRFGSELQPSSENLTSQSDQGETKNPYQSDASMSPGVLEFQERLLQDQLAQELYTLIMKLQRKAAWIDPDLLRDPILHTDLGQQPDKLKASMLKKSEIIAAYLAEKTIGSRVPNLGETEPTMDPDLILPLIPSHPATETLNFNPVLDFVKALCEVLSLEPSIKRKVDGIRKDLLRLINVREFSVDAIWIPPHQIQDCPLDQDPRDIYFDPSAVRSLLVYLPEVACPNCNYTRDIDVCRDTNLVRLVDSTQSQNNADGESTELAYWSWCCPHCRTVYPRNRLEDCLIQQLEQISLQHCLQDLQCPKCTIGGGIQQFVLANGGSVAQCADCSSPLALTIPTGRALLRRLDVYRVVALNFGFKALEQTAFWLIQGLH